MPATKTASTAPAKSWLDASTVEQIAEENASLGRYVNPSKLEPGTDHRFRFFGEGVTGFELWTTDKKPVRYATMPTEDEYPANVAVDEKTGDVKVSRFICGLVYDYQAEEFKILSITQKSLMNQLFKYMKDPDYGDPTEYDIKVSKTGSGLETKYSLVPAPPKAPLSSIAAKYEETHCDLGAWMEGKDPFAKAED